MTMQKFMTFLPKLRNVYFTSLKGGIVPKYFVDPYLPTIRVLSVIRVYRLNEMNRVVDII